MIDLNRALRPLALLAATGVLIAACSGGASPTTAPTAVPATPTATQAPAGVEVTVASNALGDIVVDGDGKTLYLFTKDTQGDGKSVCNGDCATAWPPLLADAGPAAAGAGLVGTLGTATRDDGATQVTLNGWPLYYFAGDAAPGETKGQGLNDVWWVLSAAGDAIGADAAAAPSVNVASGALGDFAVDGDGKTLYLFTKDTQGDGKSVCNGDCVAAWPPLLVEAGASPTAGAGLTGALGTATRDDGSTQVTLNGWPLYYFAGDAAAGETKGQGVGGVWYLLSAAGDQIGG